MNHVFSNILITKEQISNILKIIKQPMFSTQEFVVLYIQSQQAIADCPSNTFSLKVFITYLESLNSFRIFFEFLRDNLIDMTIGKYEYKIIQQRRKYFIEHQLTFEIPPESCTAYLYRKVFTHSLPPYHFDYILPFKNSLEMEEMLFGVKKYFGYAYRMKSSQPLLTQSSNCSTKSSTLSLLKRGSSSFSTNSVRAQQKRKRTLTSVSVMSPKKVKSLISMNKVAPLT